MSSLAKILRDKLIPWSQHNAAERFIVWRTKTNAANIPSAAQLVRRKITSNRKVVKNLRLYNNMRGISATWPEAGLNEVKGISINPELSKSIQADNFTKGFCLKAPTRASNSS